MNKHKAILPFLALAAVAILLWILREYAHVDLPGFTIYFRKVAIFIGTLTVARWFAIVAFIYYAIRKKSLTVWIVAGMFIGAELGHDWPSSAASLQVLSTIFLRLVKTIVAPLIFSTLVVGIANHP